MQTIFAAVRVLVLIVLFICTAVIFSIGLLFCLPKRKWKISWKNKVISLLARVTSAIIGLRINIMGRPPKPPFFLVSNHLSYVDILLFWAHLKITFIAKSEISKWPLIGTVARHLGIIFINRESKRDIKRVNNLIERAMGPDQGIILFPEATSSKGRHVLPFKSSLLFYPARHQIPVHYVSIFI